MAVVLCLWLGSDASIISFELFNVSTLCILLHRGWHNSCSQHIGGRSICKLASIFDVILTVHRR